MPQAHDARWAAIDRYFADLLAPQDSALLNAVANNKAAGLPPHDVTPLQGRLLQVLVHAIGARTVLEIGTLGAFSTIWLARALPPGGKVVTLEAKPIHAAVAQGNLRRAGLDGVVDVVVGRAAASLAKLVENGDGPFDMVFIDADKENSCEYLDWAIQLSRPGTVIILDNVVRDGAVMDSTSADPTVVGVRRFLDKLATNPRLLASAVQTVGRKGYDGFAIAVVRNDGAQ